MAYDPVSTSTLVFGGRNSSNGSYSGETYRWDGVMWRRLDLATKPTGRRLHKMASRVGNDTHIVMSAGYLDDGSFQGLLTNETWVWDGSIWDRRCDSFPTDFCFTPPQPVSEAGLAWDGQGVLYFGGRDAGSNPVTPMRRWSGSNWSVACNTAPCNEAVPVARFGHSMAFHAGLDELVLFGGGTDFSHLKDTWLWDRSQWVQQADAPDELTGRVNAAMVYDAGRDKIMLFGGALAFAVSGQSCRGDDFFCRDTWEWNGSTWTERFPTDASADGRPTPGSSVPTAYDEARGRTILLNNGFQSSAETWAWNSAADQRSGHVFGAVFESAFTSGKEAIQDISVRWSGAGVGYPEGRTAAGIQLLMWDTDRWRVLASSHLDDPNSLKQLLWRMSEDDQWDQLDTQDLKRLHFGPQRTLYFALRPLYPNGTGTSYGQLLSDYVEVSIAYRLP
ncbi:MAG: hypothetical protein R3C68_08440 [Myxococcota bacterium]